MRAKLIKFETTDYDIQDDSRPFVRMYKRYGNPIQMEDMYSSPTYQESTIEKIEYDRITVMDANKQIHNYYVNFKEANHVLPILDGLVQTKTKELSNKVWMLETSLGKSEDKLSETKAELREIKNHWLFKLAKFFKIFES